MEALPAFLLDRGLEEKAKELTSKIKQQRQEKAAKYSVPIAKVEGISEKDWEEKNQALEAVC
ncbi:unnamed protein product [Medioppia subpectinata]|uniref:Uncharacterized protein n=1 Tax=Medioppia subpectinata TaxID=1979941 RepID=A0A7R9PT11_9ACAR|nr:unnamed protein product [Medioppia subpectinata]CAG2099942.1 unnamed protein product [Medioppia subpectinata]